MLDRVQDAHTRMELRIRRSHCKRHGRGRIVYCIVRRNIFGSDECKLEKERTSEDFVFELSLRMILARHTFETFLIAVGRDQRDATVLAVPPSPK